MHPLTAFTYTVLSCNWIALRNSLSIFYYKNKNKIIEILKCKMFNQPQPNSKNMIGIGYDRLLIDTQQFRSNNSLPVIRRCKITTN